MHKLIHLVPYHHIISSGCDKVAFSDTQDPGVSVKILFINYDPVQSICHINKAQL